MQNACHIRLGTHEKPKNCMGAALGFAAIAAMLARGSLRVAGHSRLLAIGGAFLAAFVTYEGLRYIVALSALGGADFADYCA